mgnify:CR=1 FL=1
MNVCPTWSAHVIAIADHVSVPSPRRTASRDELEPATRASSSLPRAYESTLRCSRPRALPDAAPAPLPALADDETPPQATHLAIGPDTDWTALTVWLSALLHARGDRIVRVKGVIAAPAGRLLLQGVRREVQRPEIMPASGQPDARDNLLVLIGRGYAPGDLARSLAGFTRMKQPPTAPAITTK